MSETIVQKKLAKLIQQELGTILNRYDKLVKGKIITVSIVRITRDLGLAKVYISIFPDEALEEVVDKLNENTWEIRYHLAGKIKNKIRKIPDLQFYKDDSFQEAERINNLLNSLQSDKEANEDSADS